MTEISYEFWFDAAHQFLHKPIGHKYRGLHGHSFRAEVTVKGKPDPETGFVVDFSELEAAGERLRDLLDHRFLNEIEGLGNPSLENIARFVWVQLQSKFPGLVCVQIRRDSHRQSCIYRGDDSEQTVDALPLVKAI